MNTQLHIFGDLYNMKLTTRLNLPERSSRLRIMSLGLHVLLGLQTYCKHVAAIIY